MTHHKLVIAEKPSVAQSIAAVLDGTPNDKETLLKLAAERK